MTSMDVGTPSPGAEDASPRASGRRLHWPWLLLKLVVSAGLLYLIARKVLARQGAEQLAEHLQELRWQWIAVAAAAQLGAMTTSVLRWDRLLRGQGIEAPFRYLFGSFWIGRFFGAFTPGGWTGLNGYRLYDIAVRTGKAARATATIGVEMLLGQLAFGAVVIAGSVYGMRYLGAGGLLLVDGFFLAVMVAAILLLSRPKLFRWLAARLLPRPLQARVASLVDAVCAYEGKGWLLVQATVLGMGTHVFNNLIYVGAAQALGVDLSPGEVFFVSSLQIFATVLPISIGGVGLREAAAVSLYTLVGVPASLAVLVPVVGISVEYAISAVGGLLFLLRRQRGRDPRIVVHDAEREARRYAELAEEVPLAERPRPLQGLKVGLAAGLLAGGLVGATEAVVVLAGVRGHAETPQVAILYGTALYGAMLGLGGAAGGALLAWAGRRIGWRVRPPHKALAGWFAVLLVPPAFALTAFRVRRDLYAEQLVWKSAEGLQVALLCLGVALGLALLLGGLLQVAARRGPGTLLRRPLGALLAMAALSGSLAAAAHASSEAAAQPRAGERARPAAPAQATNVVFVVVDTLRADHLPLYGYAKGHTPNLDAFARDAVVFEHAFSQASWTRPSFATMLSGRFAASHRVMHKPDALPDELVTLPEALSAAGFATAGFVTNYNVAPYYNFQQGFDTYRYLEPEFVLGADDTAAKLLAVQALKRVVERVRAAQPGSAYQDAEAVNRALFEWLEHRPESPWLLFAAYMDPHDPYFEHPYRGPGYSRAAHPHPDRAEAERLRRLYDGEITYWDEHFGALVQKLKDEGIYDESIIVVTADHGEEFADHGGFWHGTTLYDEQVHVPLLVKLPYGERAGERVDHWVQHVDLMPTLLRRLGVEVPEGVQGGELFEGTTEVFSEEDHEGNVLRAVRVRRGLEALKFIEANAGNPRGLPDRQLFRVDMDPGERVDLAQEAPERLRIAQEHLRAAAERARSGAVHRRAVDPSGDPDAEARLRALGYAE